jgi:hypothetical protein
MPPTVEVDDDNRDIGNLSTMRPHQIVTSTWRAGGS